MDLTEGVKWMYVSLFRIEKRADADVSHLLVLLEIDHLREDLVIDLKIKLHSDLLMDPTMVPF